MLRGDKKEIKEIESRIKTREEAKRNFFEERGEDLRILERKKKEERIEMREIIKEIGKSKGRRDGKE